MRPRVLFGLLFALLSCPAFAGSDGQLWMDAGLRVRPTKKVRLTVTQHVRLDEDLSRLDSLKSDLAADVKVQKWLRVGGGYRFTMGANKSGVLGPEHRLHVQAQVSEKVGAIKLSYRLRLQEGFEAKSAGLDLTHSIRNRVGAALDTDSAFTPSLSVESFNRVADKAPVLLQKMRVTAGVEIRPNKENVFDLYFRTQTPVYDPTDLTEYIIGVSYQFRLPR
jgi:hypothetical protein